MRVHSPSLPLKPNIINVGRYKLEACGPRTVHPRSRARQFALYIESGSAIPNGQADAIGIRIKLDITE